jgi:hypothetical protein
MKGYWHTGEVLSRLKIILGKSAVSLCEEYLLQACLNTITKKGGWLLSLPCKLHVPPTYILFNHLPKNTGLLFYPVLMTPTVEGYPGRCRLLCNKDATICESDERKFLCSVKSTHYETCYVVSSTISKAPHLTLLLVCNDCARVIYIYF